MGTHKIKKQKIVYLKKFSNYINILNKNIILLTYYDFIIFMDMLLIYLVLNFFIIYYMDNGRLSFV